MLTGLNLGVTKVVSGGVSSPTITDMAGFDSAKAFFNYTLPVGNGLRVPILFWLVLVVVATWILLRTGSATGSSPPGVTRSPPARSASR